MMAADMKLRFLILLAALLITAAPGCAPKRVVQPTVIPGPTPAAQAQRTRPPAGRLPAGDQSAALLIPDDEDDDAFPAGPPVPDDLPELADTLDEEATPGDRVAQLARTQVGKPYSWGAEGPERFDCSGLALYVYRQLGIALPRVSADQASAGIHVERDELQPGDLVFFSVRRAFDHVGIFLGNNRFVHAPRRKEPVRVDDLDNAWWNRAYRGARRVFGGEP